MTDIGYDDRTRAPNPQRSPQHAASGTMNAVGSAASDTAAEAKDQGRQVAGEVKHQARNLAADVKSRVGSEARGQNDRIADGIRRFADELDDMIRVRDDSPARGVVTQVSQGGRRVADYLGEHGPEGVLREVQDFARRRPGTFLAVAAAAGFVAGRLGKGVLNAGSSGSTSSSTSSLSSAGSAGSTPDTSPWAAPTEAAVADVQPALPDDGVTLSSSSTTYAGTQVQPGIPPAPPQPVTTPGYPAVGPDDPYRDARP
jgi:ElaB/YqjD/DUF883 family membrane-anchored ribosome-binding protein